MLPSISEDDENQSDAESKQVPSTSPSKNGLVRSPMHNSTSPRHTKLLQRYFLKFILCLFEVTIFINGIFFFLKRHFLNHICPKEKKMKPVKYYGDATFSFAVFPFIFVYLPNFIYVVIFHCSY